MAFVAINQNGEAFLERRPDQGLLGGWWRFRQLAGHKQIGRMLMFAATMLRHFPQIGATFRTGHHIFTHFSLEMTIYYAETDRSQLGTDTGWWQVPNPSQLPSLMRKVWKQVQAS